MKKFLVFLFALVLICGQAFAFSTTKTAERRWNDAITGNSYVEVYGTMAFDSDYPCNAATSRCGEDLIATQLGMSAVSYMQIENVVTNSTTNQLFVPKYYTGGTSGSGGTSGRVVLYYSQIAGSAASSTFTSQGALVSAPTYDLSAVTSVPFHAIGTL